MSITCKKITGNVNTTVTLGKCSGNTGTGSLPIGVSTLIGSGGVIPWLNGQTTVLGPSTVSILSNNLKCKAPNTNEGFKASVVADTTGSVAIPGTAKGGLCITPPTGAIKASKPLKIT